MLIGARTAAWSGGGGWVNPYITDGLVAMWDGEWNAKGGSKDPSATEWIELINNTKTSLVTGPKAESSATMSFNNQSAIISNAMLKIAQDNAGLANIFDSLKFSVEAVCRFRYRGYLFSVRQGGIWQNGSNYDVCEIFGKQVGGTYRKGFNNNIASYHSFVYDTNKVDVYDEQNGTIYTRTTSSLSFTTPWYVGRDDFYILGNPYPYSDFSFNGEVKCIRVYNRPLTSSEIQHNYLIDKARFNLP